MMLGLRPGRGGVVRAAAHVHSEWSDDGSWSLSRVAETFAKLGHEVVLMSEHSRGFSAAKWQEYTDACRQESSARLLLVPGIEYGDADDTVHMPVWGQVPFFGDGLPTGKLLAEACGSGGVAIWAHPWRRQAWRRYEPSWLDYLAGVEVWNRKYDGIAPSREALTLARREGIKLSVALDFHTRRQLFPLTLALDLDRSPLSEQRGGLTEASVCAALAARRFSARAFGLPPERLARGPAGVALRGLERARKTTMSALR
jgi:hypothetical protein